MRDDLRPPGIAIEVPRLALGGVPVLRDLSLHLAAGRTTCLLGPSGVGKTTLLRLVAGLAAPSEGRIDCPAATRGEIGFVFQEPTLMPWATALANVMLPLRLARIGRAEARLRAGGALAAVGLAAFAGAYPRALSGGMRMRVAIARALVARPRLLLMDEPFAALDEIARFRLNDDLLALWREHGFTVIFVTHSVFESVYLAERVLVMAATPGRIVDDIALASPARHEDGFRTSAEYAARCRRVSRALQAAMAA